MQVTPAESVENFAQTASSSRLKGGLRQGAPNRSKKEICVQPLRFQSLFLGWARTGGVKGGADKYIISVRLQACRSSGTFSGSSSELPLIACSLVAKLLRAGLL